MNQNEKNLKIIPKINSQLAIKVIDDIWFSDIQPLTFNSYLKEDKLCVESIDKYNFYEIFSEIREVNNYVAFSDLQEYTDHDNANIVQFDLEAFASNSKLEFEFIYKNCSNYIIYNTVIDKPYSIISSLTFLDQYDVPLQNTWFSAFTDPVSKKLYFTSNYDSIYTLLEYIDFKELKNNVNNYK